MKIVKSPLICASTLLLFSCYTARADHKEIQGRTGLPKVIEGKNNVSIEKGVVYMDAVAGELMITQEFWLHYPGPPLERGVQPIRVAVREDYYRGRDIKPAPPVTTFEAKGFTKFNVYMDGRKIETMAEPWKVNSKRDTASRLRTWDVTFMPGEKRMPRWRASSRDQRTSTSGLYGGSIEKGLRTGTSTSSFLRNTVAAATRIGEKSCGSPR